MGRKRRDLTDYRHKRDPGRTNEPFGPAPDSSAAGGATRQGEFVVHLHDARRRHHDLRLEVGGVLESFAVPKGPSLRPADKRLAVQTEPHPLDYLDFEDVIPEGSYGAGAMIVWDRGRVRYLGEGAEEGLAAGKLDFELRGHKLRGRFALVRTSDRRGGKARPGDKDEWLLFKKDDAFADAKRDVVEEAPHSVRSGLTVEELPQAADRGAAIDRRCGELGAPRRPVEAARLVPMLCVTEGAPLSGEDWLYELKLDGVRILAERRHDEVGLFYRTRRTATPAYPEVVEALRAMVPDRFVLDGEVVAFDDAGKPSFQRLARRIHASRPFDVQLAMRSVPVVYVVFDVLAVGAHDLTPLPLEARKEILAELVRGAGPVRRLDHLAGDGRPLLQLCETHDLEGLVAKRRSSSYRPGERSPDWVKIKCARDEDFVVVGFTRGERSRAPLGALDLASFDAQGRLRVRGKAGSGLDGESIQRLRERLDPLVREDCAAEGELERAPRGRAFVEPRVVVRVRFDGWTDDGRLRHPVFLGIREDTEPEGCTAAPPPDDATLMAAAEPSARPQGTSREAGRRRVVLTNQDKVFWPEDGYTKGDLCDYYEAVAPWLLPYLRDRPVVLVRHPDGIHGKRFYQWNLPQGTPTWVRTFPLRREDGGGDEASTFLVDDLDTLLFIANLGAIPIHVLASRTSHPEACDFLTIDLDVGGGTFRDAITLARELHALLEEIGVEGYPKTSGQSGLHVLVPLGPGVSFEAARTLGELLGRLLVSRHPRIATMERTKRKRGNRVYVDTGQIGRSRTIVAPYSVRAHPGATVSTPLLWDEVGHALDPRRHTIASVPGRLASHGDPMAPLLEASPDLAAAVAALESRINAEG
ncbi:MAG: DNA ligase D [Myxococcota bacterium]